MAQAASAYITAAVLFASTPACAQQVLLPPERYDRPVQNVTIVHLPYKQVHGRCVEMGAPAVQAGYGRIEGCSIAFDRIMVIPTPESVGWRKYACIYRHEAGHINGWPTHHDGGRYSGEC